MPDRKNFKKSIHRSSPIAFISFFLILGSGCSRKPVAPVANQKQSDSIKIEAYLHKGDSVYAIRNGMSTIGKSLFYFDSAQRIAERLKDTALLAKTLYFTGNVYNAWNKQPKTTIAFYKRSAELMAHVPSYRVRRYYLLYLIAHAYDNEKGQDSANSIRVIRHAMLSLSEQKQRFRDSLEFLSDFAWVSTNCNNYDLADSILSKLVTRSNIKNNPTSNNYLDHYFITKARIDVYKIKRSQSFYIDSLSSALQKCNNRFDSSYYSLNLADLNAYLGNYKKAYYFLNLKQKLQDGIDNSDVLVNLHERSLSAQLQIEKEKQKLVFKEVQNKNLLLLIAALFLIVIVLLFILDRLSKKRKKEKDEIARQAAFTDQLLQKEEQERKRIATELHDGVNHDLLDIKNRLLLQQPVSAVDVEQISDSIREVCRNMYPALFEKVGLITSVQALSERFTNNGLFTTCDIQYKTELTKSDELQLYRIIQEALTNIFKHAEAEAAKITIQLHASEWMVEIKDNGKGFNFREMLKDPASFGLQSMLQRAKVLGAELSFESALKETKIILKKKIH